MEQVLYFILGFLSAAFIAALMVPAIWRRAVRLTRRRIEASVPLTVEEIRAEKDGLRAGHAVEAAKLNFELKTARDKVAAQSVTMSADRRHIEAVESERAELKDQLTATEGDLRTARDDIRRKEEATAALSTALAQAEEMLAARETQFNQLGRQYEDLTYQTSQRQIEIVSRESEVERLKSQLAALRSKRKDAERASRVAGLEINAAREAAEAQKKRAEALESRIRELSGDIADRDELVERRGREVERLRGRLRPVLAAVGGTAVEGQVDELQRTNARLAAENAELAARLGGTEGVDPVKAAEDRALKLRAEIAGLLRQNKRLRDEIEAAASPARAAATLDLRERMQSLAAEMVALTAAVEGPQSPIEAVLAQPELPFEGVSRPVSLARRIKALRAARQPS